METKKISLVDREEFQRIVSNIILNYRIDMAEMLDYAERRKIRKKIQGMIVELTYSTIATFYKMWQ